MTIRLQPVVFYTVIAAASLQAMLGSGVVTAAPPYLAMNIGFLNEAVLPTGL